MGDLLLSGVSLLNGSGVLDGYRSDAELAAVKLFGQYPEGMLQLAAACCFLFMLVGIPGNLITIIALARHKKIRNATALFIINLSCSDLLYCCSVLPLTACLFLKRAWTLGTTLCHLYSLLNYGLTATSVCSIILITVNRYVMVAHPEIYTRLYNKQNILLMVIGAWFCAFGMLMPTYFEIFGRFTLDRCIGFCTIIPDDKDRSPKTFFVVMAFVAPFTTMILCYSRILWLVKKSARKSGDRKYEQTNSSDAKTGVVQDISMPEYSSDYSTKEDIESSQNKSNVSTAVRIIRKNIRETYRRARGRPRTGPTKKDKKLRSMIMAIIIAFFSCHLPIMMAKTISNESYYATIMGYILIYLTTCINPLIYVVMSREYRQAYKNIFSR